MLRSISRLVDTSVAVLAEIYRLGHPEKIYSRCKNTYPLGRSMQKVFYVILKSESLVDTPSSDWSVILRKLSPSLYMARKSRIDRGMRECSRRDWIVVTFFGFFSEF